MSGRAAVAGLIALIAVVSTAVIVITAPEMMAARRITQRFAEDLSPSPESPVMMHVRRFLERLDRSHVMPSVRDRIDRIRRRRVDNRIPESLDRVVRHLRAGSNLTLALRRVGDVDPVLARIATELEGGSSLRHSVARWGAEDDLPNRRLTATALDLASSSGGASAQVLDGVAASLRDRVSLEREVAALSSQSKASAAVLVIAPVVFATAAAMYDDRILEVLIGRPLGWACIGLGLGLDGLGAFWMSNLISRHR